PGGTGLMPQVHQHDLRQWAILDTVRKLQEGVQSALRIRPTLEGGRGRTHQDRDVLQLGAHDRDVAGVVPRSRFLLEGPFMFLVDDDEAEVSAWREDGAASADHSLHLTAP